MNFIPAKTPGILKKIFPHYSWDIATDKKVIYLTFDDGPTPKITEWILNELSKYNAKATFFCIGKNVKEYPELYRKILAEDHIVGNHTHNHVKGWNTSSEVYLQNVAEAAQYVDSKLFRPPYGKLKLYQGKKLRKLGYKIIMWDVIAIDWDKTISKEKSAENVTKNAKKGSIVVFHDSLKAERNMKYALQATLDYFSKEGFLFKSLDVI